MDFVINFLNETGFSKLIAEPDFYKTLIMYVIIGVLFYLGVVKQFEPLLLVPIAFGMCSRPRVLSG